MKLKNIVLLFVLVFFVSSYADANSHRPGRRGPRYCHPHSHAVIVAPPPVMVVPPRPVVMVPPPPAHVWVTAHRPGPARITNHEAIRNAKNMIQSQRFEADRIRIAKGVANDLPLKTIDVLDILNMFSFESSKLDFGKFAYTRTVDQENYSIVFEAFKYTSSIKDLEDYMYSIR